MLLLSASGRCVHASGSHFAPVCFFLQSLSFVVLFSTFAQSQPNFDKATLEEYLQWHESQAVIFSGLGELANLTTIQQRFAFSLTLVIVDAGLRVFSDIAAAQPDFFMVDASIAFVERDLVIADAFDFAARQHDTAVKFVEDVEFVTCATIGADDLAFVGIICGFFAVS